MLAVSALTVADDVVADDVEDVLVADDVDDVLVDDVLAAAGGGPWWCPPGRWFIIRPAIALAWLSLIDGDADFRLAAIVAFRSSALTPFDCAISVSDLPDRNESPSSLSLMLSFFATSPITCFIAARLGITNDVADVCNWLEMLEMAMFVSLLAARLAA